MYASAALAVAAAPPPRAKRAAIAIPDGTRPVDVAAALDALRPWVDDAVAIVGLGLHRPMTEAELPASPFPIVQHDPDDTVGTTTVDGVVGGVSRHLHGCDAVLTVGIVELHQYAGFSGGHKGVSVGLGARATIDGLHHRSRVTAAGVTLGGLEGNPFRSVVDALGEAAGCSWALQFAGGRWIAGPTQLAFRTAAASLDCWVDVDRLHDAVILEVRGKKAVNFYQASRAATYIALSAQPPLSEGAVLYLDAACPEGIGLGSGESAFAALLARVPPPWAEVLAGDAPEGGGTQRAVMLALLCRRFRLVVTGCDDPAPLRAVGIEAYRQPAAQIAPSHALVVADPFGRLPRLRAGA